MAVWLYKFSLVKSAGKDANSLDEWDILVMRSENLCSEFALFDQQK